MRVSIAQLCTGAAALLTLSATAAAAPASPATLTVDRPCYILAGTPMMHFRGTGFTPRAEVVVTSPDGTVDTSVRADGAGDIAGASDPPRPDFTEPGSRVVTITARDNAARATVGVHVAPFGWAHGAVRRAKGLRAWGETTSWSFSGFAPGLPIFGHYLYRSHPVARADFGQAQGACGVLTVHAKLFPGTARHFSYTVQYDDSQRYSPTSVPRIVGPISLNV